MPATAEKKEKPVSPTAYARIRGVSHEAVRKAIDSGRISTIPGSGSRRLVIPSVADREWAENTNVGYGDTGRRDTPGVVIEDVVPWNVSRAKREQYEAEMARLKLAEQEGRVVDADEVKREWFNIVTLARNRLLGLPAKARQRIQGLTKQDIGALDELVREVLEELARGEDGKGSDR